MCCRPSCAGLDLNVEDERHSLPGDVQTSVRVVLEVEELEIDCCVQANHRCRKKATDGLVLTEW